jgi:hypothetical protein
MLDIPHGYMDELEVRRADLVGYFHPREIVADASLTVSRRRALLAHWLSDANAVRGAPGLRRSSAGVTVSVDELRAALCRLDEMTDHPSWHQDVASRLSA